MENMGNLISIGCGKSFVGGCGALNKKKFLIESKEIKS